MDGRGRKELQHFVEHIFQEGEGGFLAGTKDIRINSKLRAHFERAAGTGKFRAGGQGCQRMAGHFHFGDNGNMPFGRVGDDLPNFRLRIKPAVRNASMRPGGKTGAGAGAPGANPGKLWIFRNLDAPALILRKMPVKNIQLLQGHQVEREQNRCLAVKVAAFVQHETAPRKTGRVGDDQAGQLPINPEDWLRRFHFDRQQLAQRLQPIKDPGWIMCFDGYGFGRNRQTVGFLPK